MEPLPYTFRPPTDGGIVAGYDGSAAAEGALAWAVCEAAAHDRPLHVVRAWSLAEAVGAVHPRFGTVPSLGECEDAVSRRTEQALLRALADAGHPRIRTHLHVVHGPAIDVLLAASHSAVLLVVGHRGHPRRLPRAALTVTAILGSVAERMLLEATCPVAVLRCATPTTPTARPPDRDFGGHAPVGPRPSVG
jgi:nucleotide-binding universal stress UspA family protein